MLSAQAGNVKQFPRHHDVRFAQLVDAALNNLPAQLVDACINACVGTDAGTRKYQRQK